MLYTFRMKREYILFALLPIFFTAGYLLPKNTAIPATRLELSRSQKTDFTNPLLDCQYYTEAGIISINKMKADVGKIIDEYREKVADVSVYYRDLNNGPWMGINEKAAFAPASLLKVPLLIAYLKQAESDHNLIEKKIPFSGERLTVANMPDNEKMTPGTSYSVDQLLTRMVSLSDNAAFELLYTQIDPRKIKQVHSDLDLTFPDDNTPEDWVSVKSYAGLFRVLYNSTYLSREMSEKALRYLSHSDFHSGIIAGIPANTKTALKFGVRDVPNSAGLQQLHDCGIIYAPKNPYLLCIMTKGPSQKELVEIIGRISKTVYEEHAK